MHILLYVGAALSVLLCVGQLVLFPHRKHRHSHGTTEHPHRSRAGRRTLAFVGFIIHIVLIALGVLAAILAVIYAAGEAKAAGGERGLWALDTFLLWVEVAGLFCLLVGGTCLTAAVIHHKMRTARTVVQASAAAIIALLGQAYSVVCVAQGLYMETWVLLFGAGCAAAVGMGNVVDLYRLSRRDAPRHRRHKHKKKKRTV